MLHCQGATSSLSSRMPRRKRRGGGGAVAEELWQAWHLWGRGNSVSLINSTCKAARELGKWKWGTHVSLNVTVARVNGILQRHFERRTNGISSSDISPITQPNRAHLNPSAYPTSLPLYIPPAPSPRTPWECGTCHGEYNSNVLTWQLRGNSRGLWNH